MIRPNNYKNIDVDTMAVNGWINKIYDSPYTTRLHAYINNKLSHELSKEEVEVAKLYYDNNQRNSYFSTKISDKVFVVENPRYENGKQVNGYYFAYYGQKYIERVVYPSFEIAAMAGLLFSSMGKNAMSESILTIIMESMMKKEEN